MGDTEKGFREYNINIPVEPVLKVAHDDPRIDEYLTEMKPIIITGTKLVDSAMQWDLGYLSNHMKETEVTVLKSTNHIFKYVTEKRLLNFKSNINIKTKWTTMTVPEFMQEMNSWKEGDDRLYLQQVLDSSIAPTLIQDFLKFNWGWAKLRQKKNEWGPLTSNLLLISQEGNVTPCHYDEQQNLFAGIRGYKRCILFPPEQFECFYPHPVFHPHDRQSQVDFENPDYQRFPKFRNAKGLEAIVGPGDVLYIPLYWWHHIESKKNDDYTVSLNFWYKPKPTENIEYPLKEYHKVAIMRNIEKMVSEALETQEEVAPLMRALVLGRYTDTE